MRYNMLSYVKDAGKNKHKKTLWEVRCECGKTSIKIASQVRTGKTKSCGCLAKAGNNATHGLRKHPLYPTWCNMKARCDKKNHPSYKNYGGRGISYDSRWLSFENFLEDVGERPFEGASLDRVDNDGAYCRTNVRWANRETQRKNSRQITPVTIKGEARLITEWCSFYNISIGSVHRRMKKGESVDSALTRPKAKRFR